MFMQALFNAWCHSASVKQYLSGNLVTRLEFEVQVVELTVEPPYPDGEAYSIKFTHGPSEEEAWIQGETGKNFQLPFKIRDNQSSYSGSISSHEPDQCNILFHLHLSETWAPDSSSSSSSNPGKPTEDVFLGYPGDPGGACLISIFSKMDRLHN
ncbi:hypothetical protein B0H14DRAFT_2565465 [Mycena olivaceomarginata]|nr:hypothetical protein B0H14DRAFT_2565465 [Mycena olivaceomarginata]